MVNLDENATTLEISLLNLDGSLAAIGEPDDEALRIAGEGQQSLFVTDLSFSPPLDLSRFLGILSATSVHTVAATAVQTRPGEFATLPVSPGESDSTTAGLEVSHTLDFAQFAYGDGLFSQISLLNLAGTTDANAVLMARDEEGEPFPVQLEDLQGATLEGSIPANGGRVYQTSAQGPILAGSLRVESDQPLAGVPPGRAMESGFRTFIYIDNPSGINTGIAIVNLENQVISLEPRLFHPGGEPPCGRARHRPGHPDSCSRTAPLFRDGLRLDTGQSQSLLRNPRARRLGAIRGYRRPDSPGQFAVLPVARLLE